MSSATAISTKKRTRSEHKRSAPGRQQDPKRPKRGGSGGGGGSNDSKRGGQTENDEQEDGEPLVYPVLPKYADGEWDTLTKQQLWSVLRSIGQEPPSWSATKHVFVTAMKQYIKRKGPKPTVADVRKAVVLFEHGRVGDETDAVSSDDDEGKEEKLAKRSVPKPKEKATRNADLGEEDEQDDDDNLSGEEDEVGTGRVPAAKKALLDGYRKVTGPISDEDADDGEKRRKEMKGRGKPKAAPSPEIVVTMSGKSNLGTDDVLTKLLAEAKEREAKEKKTEIRKAAEEMGMAKLRCCGMPVRSPVCGVCKQLTGLLPDEAGSSSVSGSSAPLLSSSSSSSSSSSHSDDSLVRRFNENPVTSHVSKPQIEKFNKGNYIDLADILPPSLEARDSETVRETLHTLGEGQVVYIEKANTGKKGKIESLLEWELAFEVLETGMGIVSPHRLGELRAYRVLLRSFLRIIGFAKVYQYDRNLRLKRRGLNPQKPWNEFDTVTYTLVTVDKNSGGGAGGGGGEDER